MPTLNTRIKLKYDTLEFSVVVNEIVSSLNFSSLLYQQATQDET